MQLEIIGGLREFPRFSAEKSKNSLFLDAIDGRLPAIPTGVLVEICAFEQSTKISLEKSMKKNAERMPRARQRGLIIEDLPGEVLVFDSERDRAHCLNQTAALVWKYCDGKTKVSQMARNLERDLNTPNVDERMVSYALEQLSRDHLLEESIVPAAMLSGITRRQMIRTLGIAAVIAVPVVTSIVVPTAQAATSCVSTGGGCASSAQCCSGLCSGGTCA